MTYRWKLTRLASVLLAAGFFFLSACNTTESAFHENDSPDNQSSSESSLRNLDRRIAASDQPAPLLIERLELLHRIARNSAPNQRLLYYEEMVQTAGSPELLADPWAMERDERITLAFEEEFEDGESSLSEEVSSSQAHFRNAITLRPTESDPYRHLSSLHYREDQIPTAIDILLEARVQLPSFPEDLQERLAFLYLESGNMDQAIALYRELVEQTPDQIEIRHALVNAYILNENHEDAVQELRTLLEMEPNDQRYRQSLATELFFHLQDHWMSTPAANRNEGEIRADLEWMDEAIEHLEEMDAESEGLEQAYTLAQFYRNSGIYLLREAQELPERPATELISRGEFLLKEAVPYWQQLTEQTPGNRELWLHLQEIYRELGLDEQARQIEERLESQATES